MGGVGKGWSDKEDGIGMFGVVGVGGDGVYPARLLFQLLVAVSCVWCPVTGYIQVPLL